ncbi:hypothetical protein ACP4OV_013618 [Aristida adscensionis]
MQPDSEATGGLCVAVDEGPSPASRTAARLVHEVVSSLDERKRRVVRSIGFEGMLHFPAMGHINRRFSAWLMYRVELDAAAGPALAVAGGGGGGGGRRIGLAREDVALVFGIPCSGKSVAGGRRRRRRPRDAREEGGS